MRTPTLIVALAVAGAGLLTACGSADAAQPPLRGKPTDPAPTTTSATTKPGPTTIRELPEVDPALVPEDSLLREFIGGSALPY